MSRKNNPKRNTKRIAGQFNDQKGVVLVEATIVSIWFLFIVFGFFAYAIYIYQSVVLQYILDYTTRELTIGKVQPEGSSYKVTLYTYAELDAILKKKSEDLDLLLTDSDVRFCPADEVINGRCPERSSILANCNETTLTKCNLVVDETIVIEAEKPYLSLGIYGVGRGLLLRGRSIGRPETNINQ